MNEANSYFLKLLEEFPQYQTKPSLELLVAECYLNQADYKQAEAKPDMVGVGGKEYFTFEGLKKGDTKVTLDYQRSWEQGSVDQKVFNVSVK